MASSGTLRAGFGRIDLTPPPGVGLGGNGPEGRTSTGYRYRLYARAVVLEDAEGERIALVAVDLPMLSPNLHRLAAERVVGETGIGADRLVLSATHTHSGPGHHYAERQYNANATRLPGHDPALVEFLVSRIARAVLEAARDLAPARAAWGFQTVKGFSRNRSFRAYCRNEPAERTPCPGEPGGSAPDSLTRAVDTVWALLRVDRDLGQGFRPAGAYSVFAIHGTANPSVTTLLDGDIHAVVERELERRIDALNGDQPGFAPRAVHVFANGNEGDVSPNRDPRTTQCPVPTLRPPPFAGPRAPAAPWEWADAPDTTIVRCFGAARRFIDSVGAEMGDSAFANFMRLDAALSGDLRIARAFTTVRLPGHDGLCPAALVGSSTAAGASDVPTRVAGWKLYGLVPIGIEQGGSAARPRPEGCHGAKRPLFGRLQRPLVVGEHGFAEAGQLAVVKIGDVLLGAVPAEPTVTVGRLFREAMRRGADSAGRLGLQAVVVGLANGYLQYVTTRAEYAEQAYEGGSTLYGPGTAEAFAGELETLGRSLAETGFRSPAPQVLPITAYPGAPRAVLPRPTAGPALVGPPRLVRRECAADGALHLTWLDEPPGRLVPAEGQVLAIEARIGDGWRSVAWDDQGDVVIEAIGPKRNRGFLWRVTLSRATAGTTLRLKVLARLERGFPGFVSAPVTGCPLGDVRVGS